MRSKSGCTLGVNLVKKYQQAKDNGDKNGMDALKDEWIKTDDDMRDVDNNNNNNNTESKDEIKDNNNNNIKFPVQVFVRFRPLIKSEIEGKDNEIIFSINYISK